MLFAIPIREVSEWLKELAWKASIWVTVSRVRIPSSLQKKTTGYNCFMHFIPSITP